MALFNVPLFVLFQTKGALRKFGMKKRKSTKKQKKEGQSLEVIIMNCDGSVCVLQMRTGEVVLLFCIFRKQEVD